MKRVFRLARTGPDFLMDELTDALKTDVWFEFNPLFLQVYGKLRERKAIGGGQELLRLRIYDKLQGLVQRGIVEKNGKQYRGIASALAALAERVAAQHCQRLLDIVKLPGDQKATSD
jgi:hypothetical protein